jgi:hypothetical protein
MSRSALRTRAFFMAVSGGWVVAAEASAEPASCSDENPWIPGQLSNEQDRRIGLAKQGF